MIMKYMVGGLIAIVLIIGYFINKSNKEDMVRLKQAEVAQKQNLENQKLAEIQAQEKLELEIRLKKQELEKSNKLSELEKTKKIEMEQQEYNLFMSLLNKWMAQDNIAGSTARIAASTPVTDLRKIHDELRSTSFKGCLVDAKTKLLDAMNDELTMYLYFMQNDIKGNEEIPRLKINYYNKLADGIELSTKCKNEFGLKANSY